MNYCGETVRTITTTKIFCIHSTDCEGRTVGPYVGWAYDRSAAQLIVEAQPDKMGIIKETEALVIQKEDSTEDVWLLARHTPITAAEVEACEDEARNVLIKRAQEKLTPAELLALSGCQEIVDDDDPPADESGIVIGEEGRLEAICADCGQAIYKDDGEWKHTDGITYRHPCRPKTLPPTTR